MEKLLHERLKKHNNNLCPIKAFKGIEICPENVDCKTCRESALNDLADEIERYYIPRPRFEDGEPVQFGSDVDGCTGCIEYILMYSDGSKVLYGENDDINDRFEGVRLEPSKSAKRPIQKTAFNVSDLTHREPDSLEKLRDDMRKSAEHYKQFPGHIPQVEMAEYADRLTAIMERE